jgi:tRNA threonylcarbamoyladenosine biosynthesis protein TsaE
MQVISKSYHDTLLIGNKIAKLLLPGDIIGLCGELGSGKTVLSKGVAKGLGIKDEEVLSPTFVIIRQYEQARIPMYHFDLYRLTLPEDIEALGYEEYFFGQGVSVIEWPERLGFLAPKEYLKIELKITGKDRRRLRFIAFGRRYEKILKDLR